MSLQLFKSMSPLAQPLQTYFEPKADLTMWYGRPISTFTYRMLRNQRRDATGMPTNLPQTIVLQILQYVDIDARAVVFFGYQRLDPRSRFGLSQKQIILCRDDELGRSVFDQLLLGPDPLPQLEKFQAPDGSDCVELRNRATVNAGACCMYFVRCV